MLLAVGAAAIIGLLCGCSGGADPCAYACCCHPGFFISCLETTHEDVLLRHSTLWHHRHTSSQLLLGIVVSFVSLTTVRCDSQAVDIDVGTSFKRMVLTSRSYVSLSGRPVASRLASLVSSLVGVVVVVVVVVVWRAFAVSAHLH